MFKKLMTLTVLVLLIASMTACDSSAPSMGRNEDVPPAREGQMAPGGSGGEMQGGPGGEMPSGPGGDAPAPGGDTSSAPGGDASNQAPAASSSATATAGSYPIVDTGQTACYDDSVQIACPTEGQPYYGQDAQIAGAAASYTAQGGTVTDNVTGLMWQQSPDTHGDGAITTDDKFTQSGAVAYCEGLSLGGYDDWRLPDIKTLYSLVDFRGTDPMIAGNDTSQLIPFIDTDAFDFGYGDIDAGERVIDAQFASSTLYVSTVMNGSQAMFGLNLADGRIKGYGLTAGGGGPELDFYTLCVRGNESYGVNSFSGNGDGTITDSATGLMWAQDDSGFGMDWEEALAWVEQMNAEAYLGYSDWRLPNAKELQSLVDYTRSPDTTSSAAIDPLFNATGITNEAGQADFAYYWTSTSFQRSDRSATDAVYVAFGRGLGSMDGSTVIDVHGAGCQRSDPKKDDSGQYPSWGHGPQGDLRRVDNFVRLVRGGITGEIVTGGEEAPVTGDAGGQPSEGEPPSGEGQGPGAGQSPPAEAIAACSGESADATCTVQTPDGELSGTCQQVEETLACVPEGGPGGGQPPAP